MDIQQLRSWIFELYEPLENERQYIVFDAARGNLLIDVPRFSERALRMIRGTGRASLLVVTNRVRAADAHRYRDAMGIAVACHERDADAVEGGPDVALSDDQALRPDARALRVGDAAGSAPRDGQMSGATVLLLRKAGGVLCCGDLDLASDAARSLLGVEFSSVLSSGRPPMWSAGKDMLRRLQQELPSPRKQFGILLNSPWDRNYKGRLEDQLTPNPLVPIDQTADREAAMGPTTLVVSRVTPEKQARAPRPRRE